MLVRCPQCRTRIRLVELPRDARVIRYLCDGCRTIVGLDLKLDEVRSTSSSVDYGSLERRKTVLVADGSEAIREEADRLLSSAGCQVRLASDRRQAMGLLHGTHPDLAVVDLELPDTGGLELLEAIRRDDRIGETPVVMMTRTFNPSLPRALQRRNAQGLVCKPNLTETLVPRTRSLLDGPGDSAG